MYLFWGYMVKNTLNILEKTVHVITAPHCIPTFPYESNKSNMSSLAAISCYVLQDIMIHPRPLLARYGTSSRLPQQQLSARMVDNRITTVTLLLIEKIVGVSICFKMKKSICAKCITSKKVYNGLVMIKKMLKIFMNIWSTIALAPDHVKL